MDLLFQRYANPFLLLDELIASGRFTEFILEFINITNEEKIYDVWLHKVFDKSFETFKDAVMDSNEIANVDNQNIEATVNESFSILNNFNPNEKVGWS